MGIALRGPDATVDRHIDAPVSAVWRLLTDVRAWPSWGPSVREAVLDDGSTTISSGARGTVHTVLGPRLPFVITEFVPQRRWAWVVAGIPATGHDVFPDTRGCRVRFDVPWWATGYLAVCAVSLRRLDDLATR